LKNSFLWVIICIICLCILMVIGRMIFSHMTLMSDSLIGSINFRDKGYTLWEENKFKEYPDYKNLAIYIDLNSKTLELINLDTNRVIKKYIIATGKKETPSPIGSFRITNKAKWGRAFGTRWMGLNVPWVRYN